MTARRLARIALLFLLLAVARTAVPTEPSVRDLLDAQGLVQLPDDPDELFDANAVRRFYTRRGSKPASTGPGC